MSEKVWFITGASRGFGRVWAEGALKHGDKVVATARSAAAFLNCPRHTVTRCCRWHSTSSTGIRWRLSSADVRAEFDTNFFGALTVIQTVLPLLRKQGGGHTLRLNRLAAP